MTATELIVGAGWAAPQVPELEQDQEFLLPESGMADPEPWLVESFGARPASSGIPVNGHTVLTSGPVYQAVNIISSTLARLPILVQEREGGTNRDREDLAAWQIWNRIGNDEQTPYIVRQTLIAWGLLHGNGIGFIAGEGGRPIGMFPMTPGSVKVARLESGELVYPYTTPRGEQGVLFPHEVFHFRTLGTALWGHSPLSLFNDTFGNGIGMTRYQGHHFQNDARPSGVLATDKKTTQGMRDNLRDEWYTQHRGIDNANKIAILWEGVTWTPTSVTNEQAQFLESRKYYREEVAGIFNIPQHLLGAMENSAVRANIEEQNRTFVGNTLIPHDTTWSQETQQKLLPSSLNWNGARAPIKQITVKHNFKAMLRGDLPSRYAAYAVARQWGWASANDVLRLEDQDEIGPAGDVYLVPLNMVNAEALVATNPDALVETDDDGMPTVEAVQKVYLGVGTVITAEEAREILNRDHGAGLTGPFTAAEPPPAGPPIGLEADSVQAFARQVITQAQSVEIGNLRRAIKAGQRGKNVPYREKIAGYYATFADYLYEPLQALAGLPGFHDADAIRSAIDSYTATSHAAAAAVADNAELITTVEQWPHRVDLLLADLRKEPNE